MKGILENYTSRRQRILWHTMFWLGYIATYTFIYGSYAATYGVEFLWTVAYLPMKMAATYLVLYFVLPRYFLQKKYFMTGVMFIGAVLLASLLQHLLDLFFIYDLFYNGRDPGLQFSLPKALKIALGVYPVVAFAAFVKVAKHWYEKEKQARELEQQKLEAELNFLKGQIHPHFLFNTLNNLYALTLKKAESAPEVVLKLSELLSFMLYECNSRTVSLTKELKLIENFISLEKIRYDDRLVVHYHKKGAFSSEEIPPMLLLPFVENAFKHGASDSLDEVVVDIDVTVKDSVLTFVVENTRPEIPEKSEMEYQKGIGLKNVRRRLELLYNGYYSLKTEDLETKYRITLSTELDKLLTKST